MAIALRYIKGLGAFLNANAMGLGKSLIAELVAYALSLAAKKPGAKGPFGPHIFVCQTELLIQYTKDCLRFFKGLRKYYIVTSTPMKAPHPDVKIVFGKEEWDRFQKMIYDRRDDPSVSHPAPLSHAQLSHMGQ